MDIVGIDDTAFDEQWLLVTAIRQAVGISRRGTIPYAEATLLTRELAPVLLPEDSPLVEAYEPQIVRLYKQRARARSRIEHQDVTPLEMLEIQIEQLREEIERAHPEESVEIQSELQKLEKARSKVDETKWTESQAIGRDASAPERHLPFVGKGQGYRTYRAARDRLLRVTVLHPDPAEARVGVDMIYETYWDRETESHGNQLLVRIAALQYKMWDGQALYTSQSPNLRSQMEKMRQAFCQSGLCKWPSTPDADDRYRLPPCCAFLRPTDRVQTRDAWQVTRAWHVPVCAALSDFEPTASGHEVLRSHRMRCKAVTQDTFQELYVSSMLGSRWIDPGKLHALYERMGISDDLDRVIVHAQEYASFGALR